MPSKTPAPLHALSPLSDLAGIGKKRAQQLADHGLYCVADILHLIPQPLPPEQEHWACGDEVRCLARIIQVNNVRFRRRGSMLTIHAQRINDNTSNGHTIEARFFNAPYIANNIQTSQKYIFRGRVDKHAPDVLQSPSFRLVEKGHNPDAFAVEYQCNIHGLSDAGLEKIIMQCKQQNIQVSDPLGIMTDVAYSSDIYLLHNLHDSPTTLDNTEQTDNWKTARQRIALRECASFMWRLQTLRIERASLAATALTWDIKNINAGKKLLPFTLSQAQDNALTELAQSLQKPQAALQLLQGDVGCGKTAVAFLCAYMALRQGKQVLYLAPTTILAQQQLQTFQSWLPTQYPCHILDGKSTEQQRTDIDSFLDSEKPGILVCTHAIFSREQKKPHVALLIIDEEHKFGVEQRQQVIQQCCDNTGTHHAHIMMLSATPIPRSYAQCLYAHMELCRIPAQPQGRGIIRSEVCTQPQGKSSYKKYAHDIRQALEQGGSCILVTPYLEAEYQSVMNCYTLQQELQTHFPDHDIALLHSACSDDEKTQITTDLRNGNCRIVVSTSIIEVGIDLPLANLMLIFNSERFGLAQLHQLRGRLGRGSLDGRCMFLSPDPEKHQRLEILQTEKDGLKIAEADLKQRGAGDILGQRQHGFPEFHCTQLPQDINIMQQAQEIVSAWGSAPRRQLFADT